MSTESIIVVALVALALAVQSVRVLVALAPRERPGRLLVLGVAAILGLAVIGELAGYDWWALGIVAGLAVVELGPVVASTVKRLVRRKGDAA